MARQKLGQHFLADASILRRITEAACSAHPSSLIEIGPGKGALTEHLLARVGHVAAIELDPELASFLRERFPALELIQGDALTVDFDRWPGAPVTGNLPYYVATPIVSRVVRVGRPAVFLIQKEVAQRIAAAPGSRQYGFLSIEVQFFAAPEILFTVKPGSFRPPPEVDSAVIRLTPHCPLPNLDPASFLQFAGRAFAHKRKTLRNNLASFYSHALVDGQPEASLRAEQLSLEEFADLYRRLVGSC